MKGRSFLGHQKFTSNSLALIVLIFGVVSALFVNYFVETTKVGDAYHYGLWSLLPAFITILLSWLTREPLTALLSGIAVGAFMMGQYDLTDQILIPAMAQTGTAGLLLLYLWLLGGLLGIWSKTGAAQAFADYMIKHFVRGQRSAKLVAWVFGILFF